MSPQKRAPKVQVPKARIPPPAKALNRDGHPSWRFEHVDNGGPYPWSALTADEIKELLVGLVHYEKQTVEATIGDGSRGTHHPCELHTLAPDAQERLQTLKHDDHDRLWGFRAMGRQKERVWALRYGNVFHFLWWDPEHRVAPSMKGQKKRR